MAYICFATLVDSSVFNLHKVTIDYKIILVFISIWDFTFGLARHRWEIKIRNDFVKKLPLFIFEQIMFSLTLEK